MVLSWHSDDPVFIRNLRSLLIFGLIYTVNNKEYRDMENRWYCHSDPVSFISFLKSLLNSGLIYTVNTKEYKDMENIWYCLDGGPVTVIGILWSQLKFSLIYTVLIKKQTQTSDSVSQYPLETI